MHSRTRHWPTSCFLRRSGWASSSASTGWRHAQASSGGAGQWTLLVPEGERATALTTALDMNPETVESKCGGMTRDDEEQLCDGFAATRATGRAGSLRVDAGTAAAQDAPNSGAVSAGTGVDFGSSYYFRGIIQETKVFIAQPYLEAGLTLFEGDGALNSLSVTAGTWSSLHSGPSGSGVAPGDPQMWYETDFYASLGLGLAETWSADVTYTAYMSPNQSFGTVQCEESCVWIRWPLRPRRGRLPDEQRGGSMGIAIDAGARRREFRFAVGWFFHEWHQSTRTVAQTSLV